MIIDLRTFDAELTGKLAQESLDRAGITCNRNRSPNDPRSPFITSGLRLGSAAETTAGMGPAEMAAIGSLHGVGCSAHPKTRRDRRGPCRGASSSVPTFDPYPEA